MLTNISDLKYNIYHKKKLSNIQKQKILNIRQYSQKC